MSDNTPPPPPGTPHPSSTSSRQQLAQSTSQGHAQPMLPVQLDPATSFRFAKAPAPLALGVKAAGGGGGGGGAGKTRKSVGEAKRGSKDDAAGDDTDDETDEVVLAARAAATSTSSHSRQSGSTGGASQFKPFSVASLAPIPPFNPAEFRLGASSGQGSPPRAPFATSHASQGRTGTGFVGGFSQPPATPAVQGRSQPAHFTDRHASTSTASKTNKADGGALTGGGGTRPGPLARISAGLDPTPSTPAAPSPGGAPPAGANPKKRHRTNESVEGVPAGGTASTAAGTSTSGGRVKSVGGGGEIGGGSGGGSRKATAGGGVGAGQPTAAKRRKQDTAVGGFEGVLGQVAKWQLDAQAKEEEIRRLRAQLADKTTEAERLAADKTKLKTEMTARVKSALQRAAEAVQALQGTSSEVQKALEKFEDEKGSAQDAKEIKEELNKVKSDFSNIFLDESLELWLERNEETKVAVLKELQAKLVKGQEVIDILRDKLDLRIGELAETRDRLADFESRLAQLETTKATLSAELDAARSKASEEKLAYAEKLEAALVAGSEREEAHQARLEEVHEKGEEARRKVLERCEEVEGMLAEAGREAAEREEKHREEVRKMRQTLQAKELECGVLTQRLDIANNDLNETKRSLATLDATLQRKKADLVETEDTAAHIRAACRAHEQREVTLSEELNEMRTAYDSLKRDLETATASREADKAEIAQLEQQLRDAQERLASPSLDKAEIAAQVEQLSRLHAANHELQSANASLSDEKDSLVAAKQLLEESLQAAIEKEKRSHDERVEHFNRASRLEHELTVAQNQLSQRVEATQSLEQDLSSARAAEAAYEAKLKEVAAKADEEKKAAVRAAIASCKEASARELAQKSNELKRANNRYEDTNKKLQKVSNELAKAKGGPVLNQHIGSSSGSDPVKPMGNGVSKPPVLPDSQAQGVLARPSSELTAVDSEVGSPPDLNQLKSKTKTVKFAATDPAADKVKRSGGSPVKPFVKKADAKMKRVSTGAKADDGESEETEEEDDIINSLTPLPGAQKGRSRSTTKATYSAKKRR